MKNALIALGFVLAGSTAALADSSALDVVDTQVIPGSSVYSIDYTATAAFDGQATNDDYANPVKQPRLGDGSPVFN